MDAGKKGLTGGTYWQKQGEGQNLTEGEKSPLMVPIQYNGKPYMDQVRAFRVSQDGAIAAIVLKNSEILIYRV